MHDEGAIKTKIYFPLLMLMDQTNWRMHDLGKNTTFATILVVHRSHLKTLLTFIHYKLTSK